MGDTADAIETAVKKCDNYDESLLSIYRLDTMEKAVGKAKEIAKEKDIVVLSPASASFGMYKNFEVRGRHFKEIVKGV